jgi:hypothetical protein
MPSTYSSNLKLELMATGENSGTWGSITNTNLGTAVEQAIIGLGTVDYIADANLTISITNSNSAQAARALVLNVTSGFGSLTQTRELVVPTIEKQYIVQNNTTGGQSITVKTSGGTGITVPNGRKAHLYVDGTNVIQMFDFVDINGGAIDGTTVGANSASTGAFTSLTASGATTLNGAVALGDAAADLITVPGTINSHLLFTDNTYDIGASGATRPRNLYLAGAATIGGNLSVGGTLTLTGGVNLNGNVTVGDNASDTLTINSTITSNLLFTDNTYDIGASGATRPRNLFLAGNATISGNQTLTGTLTVDSTTDSTSTITGSIQTDGGLGVAKAVFIGTTLNVAGDATLGDATTDKVVVGGSMGVRGVTSPVTSLAVATSTATDNTFNPGIVVGPSGTASQGGYIGSRTASANQRQGLYISSNQTLTLWGDATDDKNLVLEVVHGTAPSVTTGADALLQLYADGALITLPEAGGTAVFNENGVDADFRVESDTNTHMLFVDAGTDTVNIGGLPPTYPGKLNVGGGGIFSSSTTFDPDLADSGSILLGQIDDGGGFAASGIGWKNPGVGNTAAIVSNGSVIYFGTGDSAAANSLRNRLELGVAGGAVFNQQAQDVDFRVESVANTHALFVDAGNSYVGINNSSPVAPLSITSATDGSPTLTTSYTRFYIFTGSVLENSNYQIFKVTINDIRVNALLRISLQSDNLAGIGRIVGSVMEVSVSRVDGGAIVNVKSVSNGNISLSEPVVSGNDVIFGAFNTNNGTGISINYACSVELVSVNPGSFVFTDIAPGTAHTGANWVNQTRISRDGTSELTMISGETSFNDTGADVDFRVESDTNTHALFVDAGNSRVGINQSSPLAPLDVDGNIRQSGISTQVRTASDHVGAAIFLSPYGDVPITGWIHAVETGTSNYIILACYKQSNASNVTTTTVASSGLSVQATNSGGTVTLTGYTTSGNVKMVAYVIGPTGAS